MDITAYSYIHNTINCSKNNLRMSTSRAAVQWKTDPPMDEAWAQAPILREENNICITYEFFLGKGSFTSSKSDHK